MKKFFITIGIALLAVIVLIVLFLLTVFVYNRIMLKKEETLIEEHPGQLVGVDGHNMCVYTGGSGEHTLLFLSGSGTACPILDFRSLYSLLSDDYRIVVIEKFGYGFSDVYGGERSFDTILRQDREALDKLGIEGPFILCPHSMSGLESILWAQKYPGEVEAIIGLDMVMPRGYDDFDFDGVLRYERLAAAARKMGIVRFYYSDGMLPKSLTKEEKALYRAIACRIAVNVDIISEGRAIPAAVSEIDAAPVPDIPTLLFTSDGSETKGKNWVENQKKYVSGLKNGRVIELGCKHHYAHNYEQERINREMREFIGSLDGQSVTPGL